MKSVKSDRTELGPVALDIRNSSALDKYDKEMEAPSSSFSDDVYVRGLPSGCGGRAT